jgi:hypothetical protein
LEYHVDRCRDLRDELERIRTIPPPSAVPDDRIWRRIWERRMRRLTNRDPNLVAEDEVLDIAALPPVEA